MPVAIFGYWDMPIISKYAVLLFYFVHIKQLKNKKKKMPLKYKFRVN
jgi:hypothetical protein